MNRKDIKLFFLNLIFFLFILFLLIEGVNFEEKLKQIASETYNPKLLLLFQTIFPVVVGIILGIPNFVKKNNKQGMWHLDWVILAAIGVPSLFIAMTPVL